MMNIKIKGIKIKSMPQQISMMNNITIVTDNIMINRQIMVTPIIASNTTTTTIMTGIIMMMTTELFNLTLILLFQILLIISHQKLKSIIYFPFFIFEFRCFLLIWPPKAYPFLNFAPQFLHKKYLMSSIFLPFLI